MTTKTKFAAKTPAKGATVTAVRGRAPMAAKTPTAGYWALLERFPLRPLTTAKDLDAAMMIVDELLDRPKLDAWERAYLDVLGDLVEAAEAAQHPIEAASDGETFRALCEEKGVTQQQAAAELGIANSTLSAVKGGQRRFTRDHLRRLADYFHVPAATFAD